MGAWKFQNIYWKHLFILVENGRVQILDEFKILNEAVYITHNANTRWKGMNQTILSPVLGK